MEDWVDDAVEAIERATKDPLADAYRGAVRILSVSAPAARGGYQACTLDLAIETPEIPPETVTTEVVFPKKHWPTVGAVLRARISRGEPRVVDVDWDALAR